jgi:hypothetical protein
MKQATTIQRCCIVFEKLIWPSCHYYGEYNGGHALEGLELAYLRGRRILDLLGRGRWVSDNLQDEEYNQSRKCQSGRAQHCAPMKEG